MNNKKQDWRTADSKVPSRDQADRNTTIDKPADGKKPVNTDNSSKKASPPRQTEGLNAGKTSRR